MERLTSERGNRCEICVVADNGNGKWNYCPNCGAKMDLE